MAQAETAFMDNAADGAQWTSLIKRNQSVIFELRVFLFVSDKRPNQTSHLDELRLCCMSICRQLFYVV